MFKVTATMPGVTPVLKTLCQVVACVGIDGGQQSSPRFSWTDVGNSVFLFRVIFLIIATFFM